MEPPKEERTKRGRRRLRVFCLVALLPVFYVLSYGPVVWLVAHKILDPDAAWLKAVYYPFSLMQQNIPGFNRFVLWYVDFFI